MRYRNHKYFILSVLVLFGAGLLLPLSGCSDDPANADAKQIRQETSDALNMVSQGADYDTLQSAKNKVQSAIVTNRKAGAATQDAARLASGNLTLARGRGMQSDLGLKTLPLRETIYSFEKMLRSSEGLLLEKERIEAILSSGQQEMTELEQLAQSTSGQLTEAQTQLKQLQEQREQEQAQKDKTQTVLDDYQSRSDGLLRKAELMSGDEKLQLEKQAYALLQDRKQYYIEAQASEDKIAALDGQIQLAQTKVDGLELSIQQTRQRIDDIDSSQTRIALKQQLRDVEQTLSVNQQQLASIAKSIRTELNAFGTSVQEVCDVLDEAAGEFGQVRSREAGFAADLQLAECYHQAALACAASINAQLDTSFRLQDLMASTEPAFADILQDNLPIAATIEATLSGRVMDYYDKAIEAYQKAFDAAGSMGKDAQCSVLKSQLLVVDSKMRLADKLNLPEVAEQADIKKQELTDKGQEFGVSFTQSETKKLIDYGIDYTPSLPVNLEVLAEELVARFSAWKRLPVAEQETAVQDNLEQIDELISLHGPRLAGKLEPLKREMLDAQERGFTEPVTTTNGSSIGEPNGF